MSTSPKKAKSIKTMAGPSLIHFIKSSAARWQSYFLRPSSSPLSSRSWHSARDRTDGQLVSGGTYASIVTISTDISTGAWVIHVVDSCGGAARFPPDAVVRKTAMQTM